MASGLFVLAGWPILLCVLAGIVIGAAAGAFNGFCVSYLKINFFAVTLASMSIFRGLMVAITQGSSIFQFPKEFTNIGQGHILGFQNPIWIFIIVMVIAQFLLTKTRFFRMSYYIGGNEKAARLSGINIDRTKFIYFVITGGLCGLSGVVTAARFAAVATSLATGMELRIITAVIVGGASMAGGAGTIIGTLFGSILMASLNNIITLQGADIYWQTFITGAALFVAVLADQLITINKKKQDIKSAERMLRTQEMSVPEKASKQNLSI
jgi:ribose transport system permease protein